MKNCFDNKTLSMYLDARCSRDLLSEIKVHAKECPTCREKIAAFSLTKKMLGNLDTLDISEGFDFEFNRRLDEAIAKHEKAGILEKVVEQASSGIKAALTPPIPVLAKVLIAIIFVITATFVTPYYFAKSPIDITAVYGKVEVYSYSAQRWIVASNGMRVSRNDIIKTETASIVDIGIRDMFTIRLKGDTEVMALSTLPRFRKGLASYEVAKGEILIDTKEDFKGSRFEIYTPQAIARALGTSFAVNVSGQGEVDRTWLAVLDGAVEVENRYPLYAAKKEEKVVIRAGQRTKVSFNKAPTPPSLLLEREWEKLEELYQIGQRPRVVLLISQSESRVRELLRPCSIYIYDVKPRTISERLEKAVANISQAFAEESIDKHLDAIHELESMIDEEPDRIYNPQLLLFIGTYYEFISQHEQAIAAFEEVILRYPDSQFASLAQCAIGIIYHEKLEKKGRAREAFESVISNYPNSLEESEAEKALEQLES